MNEKTQRIASGAAVSTAALIVICNFFSNLSLLSDRALKVPSSLYVSSGICIIALVAVAALFFMGQKKFGIGGIVIALYFAYACFSSITAIIDNPAIYNFHGTSVTSYRMMRMLFSVLCSGLFAAAGGLLFAGWRKSDNRNSLKNIGGVMAIIGAICGVIANVTILSTATAALYDIAIGVALFIISLPRLETEALQSQTASASAYSSQASQTPSATQLTELKQLLDQGIITQEEFYEQKKRFLQS